MLRSGGCMDLPSAGPVHAPSIPTTTATTSANRKSPGRSFAGLRRLRISGGLEQQNQQELGSPTTTGWRASDSRPVEPVEDSDVVSLQLSTSMEEPAADHSMFTNPSPFGAPMSLASSSASSPCSSESSGSSPPFARPLPSSTLSAPPSRGLLARKNVKRLSLATSTPSSTVSAPVSATSSIASRRRSMQVPPVLASARPGASWTTNKSQTTSLQISQEGSEDEEEEDQSGPSKPSSLQNRRSGVEDDEAGPDPYANGPVQILPGVYLGSEDNARDLDDLESKGITGILNVAREVVISASLPDEPSGTVRQMRDGRIRYLHLPWGHGQSDLVTNGFESGLAFMDECIAADHGVLVHCQLGISRSATMVIAYVLREAMKGNQISPSVALQSDAVALAKVRNEGMHGAYSFVKSKSAVIGPNMSLIFQLLEYEKSLKASSGSEESSPSELSLSESTLPSPTRSLSTVSSSSPNSQTEFSSPEEEEEASEIEIAEAHELDQRMIARRSSLQSLSNTNRRSRSDSNDSTCSHGSVHTASSGFSFLSTLDEDDGEGWSTSTSTLVEIDQQDQDQNGDEETNAIQGLLKSPTDEEKVPRLPTLAAQQHATEEAVRRPRTALTRLSTLKPISFKSYPQSFSLSPSTPSNTEFATPVQRHFMDSSL